MRRSHGPATVRLTRLVVPVRWLAAALVLVVAGCSGGTDTTGPEESAEDASAAHTHDHGSGGREVSQLVGNGTRDSELGYTLTDVRLPSRAGTPGVVQLRILDYDGSPETEYLTEQTKDLHLYVVRRDLAVFRHLHPTLDRDGTWSSPLTLPEPGDYRVVAEFVARNDRGTGDHVMLGDEARVPGEWTPRPGTSAPGGDDGVVSVEVTAEPSARSPRLELVVRDRHGRPVELGSYLGTYAHVTGFHTGNGAVVHTHPLGVPDPTDHGTRLGFHAVVAEPGTYLCFVQVRVDGFVHTVPVSVHAR